MRFFHLFLVILFSAVLLSCSSSQNVEKRPAGETLIVLGYPAEADGTPSWLMKERLDLALDIYKKEKVSTIIVTGGAVQNKHVEADVMKKYLMQNGVKESEIITENRSGSTFENAMYSRRILKDYGLEDPLIVTSPEHRERAKSTFALFISKFRMAS